jgi:hypothetical protein
LFRVDALWANTGMNAEGCVCVCVCGGGGGGERGREVGIGFSVFTSFSANFVL